MGRYTAIGALLWGALALGCGASVRTTVGDRADAASSTDVATTTTDGSSVPRVDVTTAPDAVVASDVAVALDRGTASDVGASPADAPAGPCAPGHLCLAPRTPVAGISVTPGRLALVWFQLEDDGPDPEPQVAYDVPFSGSLAQVDVPLAAAAAPGDAVLFCARACNDEAACPCVGGPRLAFGYAVVALDADANGRTDVARREGARADPIVAVGFVVVAQSPEAMAVASAPLNMLFTGGIAAGRAPYPLVPRDATDHALAAPAFGRAYDLNFCPPDNPACNRYLPNLN